MPKPSSAVSSVATEEATGISSLGDGEVAVDAWRAAGGRALDGPGAAVGLEPVGLDGRAIDGQSGVVDEHADAAADAGVDVVGDVADLQVDLLTGVRRQVEGGVDPSARLAGERVPRAAAAGRAARRAQRQVVAQERVERQQLAVGTRRRRRRRGSPVEVAQRGPFVGAGWCRLHDHVVERLQGAVGQLHPQCGRSRGRYAGQVERAADPLV